MGNFLSLDTLLSAVRWLLTAGGSYAVGRGWIDASATTEIVGVGASLVSLIWSITHHSQNVPAPVGSTAAALVTASK